MDTRADAWYSALSESQQWQLYAIAKRTRNWAEVVQAARDNFELTADVSRSGFYRWRDHMRQLDAEQRRLSIVASQAQAREVAASYDIKDPVFVNALLAFLNLSPSGQSTLGNPAQMFCLGQTLCQIGLVIKSSLNGQKRTIMVDLITC